MIGAKNFDEQYILADMMADRLAAVLALPSRQKIDLGSTVALQALAASAISTSMSIIPARSGATRCTAPTCRAAQAMLAQMAAWLAQRHGIALMGSLGFENAYVFAMRADRAKALHIQSLADHRRPPRI